jgi:outer membrane protein OmpA-like peptidoglycan-associated protein
VPSSDIVFDLVRFGAMKLSCIGISGTRNTLITFVLLTTVALAGALAQSLSHPYYVVVGGFAHQKNAERFTEYLHKQNYPARYAFNEGRKLYYVYIRLTDDKQKARELAYRVRAEKQFRDAWIYQGTLAGNAAEESMAASTYEAEQAAESGEEVPKEVPPVIAQPSPEETSPAPPAEKEPVVSESAPAVKPVGKDFIFQLTDAVSNEPVTGTVKLLDSETDDQYDRYAAQERVFVPAPATGKLILICNLIGYKLVKRAISYNDPVKSVKGASIGGAQEVIIPIKLVPVKRGDYIELEQVKFFEHSAIMTPASEPELIELANLLQNPKYKVRLHGHTHSDESREIVTMGKSDNFFALDPANDRTHGSAKELSRHRADAVKAYLVSKGIDAGRISTKGYGAMLAVYEHATANERIEVEILKN